MPSLTLGLIENYKKALALVHSISWDEWKKIREDASKYGLDFHYKPKRSLDLTHRMMALAEEGLRHRDLREEAYLAPLKHRLATRTTNADEIIATHKKGGIPLVLERHRYNTAANEIQQPIS